MKVQKKLEAFRKFFILPILASKMIIFTVYTLYLDANFLKESLKAYHFGQKMFIMVPKWNSKEISGNEEVILFYQGWLQKWSFPQSIRCISMIIFWKKRLTLLVKKCSYWSPNESSKEIRGIEKILYFASFCFENYHFHSLYTASRRQLFERKSKGLLFWSKNIHNGPQMKFKRN